MQHCELCKEPTKMTAMFKGMWVCMKCYSILKAKRDAEYYRNLMEATRK